MNAFEGILEDLNPANNDFIINGLDSFGELNKKIENYLTKVNKAIRDYQEKGVVTPISELDNWENAVAGDSEEKSAIKENIEPLRKESKVDNSSKSTRSQRNAFKEASQNINIQSSLPLDAKPRRPKNGDILDNIAYVKLEKISLSSSDSIEVNNVEVKMEVDKMPAPTRPAPRKKKKKEEVKIKVKQEKIEESGAKTLRDSDVIVEEPTLTVVNLVESSDESEKSIKKEVPERSTRTKTRRKKTKRARTSSEEDLKQSEQKKSKSGEGASNQSKFEDAVSTLEGQENNATFVTKSPINKNLEASSQYMNATVVVENPKYFNSLVPQTEKDLMTDDESEDEVQKKKSPLTGIPKLTKQIFSPFEQSPVKKKVQAFEKLLKQEKSDALPPRITRTKTRARAKDQEDVDGANPETKSNVKEKAKVFTPVTKKFLPKAASTTLKSNRVVRPSQNSSNESPLSTMSAKSASALKVSQAQYRERKEKEQEALKKREALLQAQIEEKKRKREEKQLKAQQQREILEKEKLKALDAQRLKDERHKQLIAEQEERKQKHREELEKKRMQAKMRALEEKKREEEQKLEQQRREKEMTAKLAKNHDDISRMLQKQKARSEMPIYMRTKAPVLPTPDCYDSDDDRYDDENIALPLWSKEDNLRHMLKCAYAAGEAVKNTFFSIQAQTPDLQDIFEVIEPQKLKRSSSAVWHKPPRFTMIPGLENHDETEEFDDE